MKHVSDFTENSLAVVLKAHYFYDILRVWCKLDATKMGVSPYSYIMAFSFIPTTVSFSCTDHKEVQVRASGGAVQRDPQRSRRAVACVAIERSSIIIAYRSKEYVLALKASSDTNRLCSTHVKSNVSSG
eukprot:IDg17507t1